MSNVFVGDLDRRVSREGLEAFAAEGAAALAGIVVGEDTPVPVIMRNDLAQMGVMRAAACADAVVVALNWHGASDEVAAICDDSGVEVVIIHRDLIDAIRPALEGRRIIGVTPGPALRAAYRIDDAAASTGPDIPEWHDLAEASQPLPTRAMTRPLMRYTSGPAREGIGVRIRPVRCGLRGPTAAGMRPSSLHGRIHGVSPQPVPGRPTPG